MLAEQRVVVRPDGSRIVVTRLRAATTTLALHAGSEDPPGAATLPADASSRISAGEQARLVAAFNGGFAASSGAGGFEAAGRILEPLRDGLASVVIDANGAASVGIWGRTVPRPGSHVVAVRQNLGLLVDNAGPSADVSSIRAWGATLGGVDRVARSALGQDAAGNLLVAASSSALPSDMAAALVGADAQVGMELDINPEWVQQDVASTPGAPLAAALATQQRPSTQYESGWIRDFFVVLAR